MFRQKDSLFVGAKREKPDLSRKKNTKKDVLEEKKRNDFGKELKTAVSSSPSHRDSTRSTVWGKDSSKNPPFSRFGLENVLTERHLPALLITPPRPRIRRRRTAHLLGAKPRVTAGIGGILGWGLRLGCRSRRQRLLEAAAAELEVGEGGVLPGCEGPGAGADAERGLVGGDLHDRHLAGEFGFPHIFPHHILLLYSMSLHSTKQREKEREGMEAGERK